MVKEDTILFCAIAVIVIAVVVGAVVMTQNNNDGDGDIYGTWELKDVLQGYYDNEGNPAVKHLDLLSAPSTKIEISKLPDVDYAGKMKIGDKEYPIYISNQMKSFRFVATNYWHSTSAEFSGFLYDNELIINAAVLDTNDEECEMLSSYYIREGSTTTLKYFDLGMKEGQEYKAAGLYAAMNMDPTTPPKKEETSLTITKIKDGFMFYTITMPNLNENTRYISFPKTTYGNLKGCAIDEEKPTFCNLTYDKEKDRISCSVIDLGLEKNETYSIVMIFNTDGSEPDIPDMENTYSGKGFHIKSTDYKPESKDVKLTLEQVETEDGNLLPILKITVDFGPDDSTEWYATALPTGSDNVIALDIVTLAEIDEKEFFGTYTAAITKDTNELMVDCYAIATDSSLSFVGQIKANLVKPNDVCNNTVEMIASNITLKEKDILNLI